MRSQGSYYNSSEYKRGAYRGYSAYNETSVAYNYPSVYIDKAEDETDLHDKQEVSLASRERRERVIHKAQLIISILVIFGGLILMMCSYTAVHEQRLTNSNLREELIDLQSQNATILADISADLSVDYIRNEAINRLGMVEPQDYQKVYISVDEQSYTVSYTEDNPEAEEGFSFSGLIDFFKGE